MNYYCAFCKINTTTKRSKVKVQWSVVMSCYPYRKVSRKYNTFVDSSCRFDEEKIVEQYLVRSCYRHRYNQHITTKHNCNILWHLIIAWYIHQNLVLCEHCHRPPIQEDPCHAL
ncbi:hypothetical protein Hanom_Chr12g01169731 [Helianthus anomalus]